MTTSHHFSDQERANLASLLDDPAFQKAVFIARRKMRQPMDNKLAPEQLVALAMERGADDFMEQLVALASPGIKPETMTLPAPKSLHRTSRETKTT